jgi:hypothetical protein
MKIIIRESISQGVMGVRVSTSCRCRVRESSLCPSARFCEDPLQLKRVTSRSCPGARIDVCEDKVVRRPSVCLGKKIKLGV